MSSQDKYSVALSSLKAGFSEGEAKAILRILREDIKDEKAFKDGLQRVLSGEPVQQVVGYTEFLGCRIELTPDVLIPRPETEELVELLLSCTSYRVPCTLLDIGTGSGCIPIVIGRKNPAWKLFASDVSPKALKQARHNAEINKVPINLILHNILSDDSWILPKAVDILVSNPPYVLRSEAALMTSQIVDHEPHLALFVEDSDPLLFYRAISEKAKVCLCAGGRIYFECNEKYAQEVAGMLIREGFNSVHIHKDISGKDRFVSAVFS